MDLPTAEFVISNKNEKVLVFNHQEYIYSYNMKKFLLGLREDAQPYA